MSDPLDRWAHDIEGPPLEKWTGNRFYRRALEMGITDPRVVANAAALLEVVSNFSDRHPGIPFDHCVEAVLSGLDESATRQYTKLSWINLWRIRLKRKWRQLWR
jgi:hypothetical protein